MEKLKEKFHTNNATLHNRQTNVFEDYDQQ